MLQPAGVVKDIVSVCVHLVLLGLSLTHVIKGREEQTHLEGQRRGRDAGAFVGDTELKVHVLQGLKPQPLRELEDLDVV